MTLRPSTVVDLARTRADAEPSGPAYAMLRSGSPDPHTISYAQLDRRSRAIAAYLQSLHLENRRVALLYPAGLEFVAAFIGCLYAGVVAVPVPLRSVRDERLSGILVDAGIGVGLTVSARLESLHRLGYGAAGGEPVRWLTTDAVADEYVTAWREPAIRATDLAYLQYTSGSTSDPKGVMVTHANVLSNLASIDREFQHGSDSVAVSWLPHFHDMGLVYGILQPLHDGFLGVLMSPTSFVQRPRRWLEAISTWRATHSGGPNFAFQLCVDRVPPADRQGLDLSSWRVAFSGAERVSASTLDRFAGAFRECGFRPSSLCAAYGLAEATLKVTSSRPAAGPLVCAFDGDALERDVVVEVGAGLPGSRTLVGCGQVADAGVRIVDAATATACGPASVGEIWVSNDSVADGYWGRPGESARVFRAATADAPARTYLRTGDLGFVHRGELFPVGRLKDLIILGGHNHHPQDIELAAASHEAVGTGGIAAFAVEGHVGERVVVVVEVARRAHGTDVPRIAAAVRRSVREGHQIAIDVVAVVRAGTIPRTPSGKLRRQACRAQFLDGTLDVIGTSTLDERPNPANAPDFTTCDLAGVDPEARPHVAEEWTMRVVAHAIHAPVTEIAVDEPLVALGVDSLQAVRIRDQIERGFGLSIPVSVLVGGATIRDCVARALASTDGVRTVGGAPAGTDGRDRPGERPSVEQERLWLLDRIEPGNAVYNIPFAARLEGPLRVALLDRCFAEVIARHEPLRSRFVTGARGPRVTIDPPIPLPGAVIDLQRLNPSHREAAASAIARQQAAASFDVGTDRLIRVALVRIEPRVHVLVVVAHHTVFDAASLTILVRELSALYDAYVHDRPSPLDALRGSYGRWAAEQRAGASAVSADADYTYWAHDELLRRRALETPANVRGSEPGTDLQFELSGALREAVVQFCRRERVTPLMALFSAYAVLLGEWGHGNVVTVGVPTAGRPSRAATDLIGLFAYPLPIAVDLEGCTFRTLLDQVRTRFLDAQTHEGIGFSKIAEAVRPRGRAPLFRAGFSIVEDPVRELSLPGIRAEWFPVSTGRAEFDVWVTLADRGAGGMRGQITVATRFGIHTAARLARRYLEILAGAVERPEAAVPGRSVPSIVIASSFTADPLEQPLRFWTSYLGLDVSPRLAPRGQVLQELLDPEGSLRTNTAGVNVLAVRLEDWLPSHAVAAASEEDLRRQLESTAEELVAATAAAVQASAVPYVVAFCRASPRIRLGAGASVVDEIEARTADRVRHLGGVTAATSAEIDALYPVAEYYDEMADRTAQVPYTKPYWAALGTFVARRVHALRTGPRKVLVLDCDDTIWLGECASPVPVVIDDSRRRLQEFVVRQRAEGMLLCLCSKNHEQDVLETFTRHPEMPLRVQDFIARRINWSPKAENLRELATELQLDLSTFVFMDDSPFECAAVRTSCPEVTTIQLPASRDLDPFLRHLWVFDRVAPTAEARARATRYEEHAQRERARQGATSLEAFLATLRLDIRCAPAQTEDCARMAELTHRTTQFNTSMVRRTENELRLLCASDPERCVAVTVSDRFGDYGLVGVMLLDPVSTAMVVDLLLLSCRALGRRVEHAMVAHLLALAHQRGSERLEIPFVSTHRNEPARRFLDGLGGWVADPGGRCYTRVLPVAAAVASS